MTTGLDGEVFYAGAPISVDTLTWTRNTDDTIDYTGATITVNFYTSLSDTSPALSITSAGATAGGSSFTKITDAAASQVASLNISSTDVATLLGPAKSEIVGYRFLLAPSGGRVANPPESGGYVGSFELRTPAYILKD